MTHISLAFILALCLSSLTSALAASHKSASAVATAAKCRARVRADIPTLARLTRNPATFCDWWLWTPRYNQPWPDLTIPRLNRLCKCLVAKPDLVPKTTMPPPKPVPGTGKKIAVNKVKLRNHTSKPLAFCRFWNKVGDRVRSPYKDLRVVDLYPLCKAIAKAASTTSSSATSTTTTSTMDRSSSSSTGPSSSTSVLPIVSSSLDTASSSTTSLTSSTLSTLQTPIVATTSSVVSSSSTITTMSAATSSSTAPSASTPTSDPSFGIRYFPDNGCSNPGLQFAYHLNVFADSDSSYSEFDPTFFASDRALISSQVQMMGGINFPQGSPVVQFYNYGPKLAPTYFALNHKMYIYASIPGIYRIVVKGPNDIALVWIGPKAYSGWNRANADGIMTRGGQVGNIDFQFALIGGTYTPLRAMLGQHLKEVVFDFTLYAPDGSIVLNGTNADPDYVLTQSCNRVTAPPFPAYGAE